MTDKVFFRFERELEALRKELAETAMRANLSSPSLSSNLGMSVPSTPGLTPSHSTEHFTTASRRQPSSEGGLGGEFAPSSASNLSVGDLSDDSSDHESDEMVVVGKPGGSTTKDGIVIGGPGVPLDLKNGFKLDVQSEETRKDR